MKYLYVFSKLWGGVWLISAIDYIFKFVNIKGITRMVNWKDFYKHQ